MTSIEHPQYGEIKITNRKKIKRLTLRVSQEGSVRVSAPHRTPQRLIIGFINSNKDWIEDQLSNTEAQIITEGDQLAHRFTIHIVQDSKLTIPKVSVSKKHNTITAAIPEDVSSESSEVQGVLEKKCLAALRSEAKSYLPQRLTQLSNEIGRPFKDVRLKNTSTRWGSCSAEKNINLNIHLMNLPHRLIDHVILHELSHTVHLNHTRDFWEELQRHDPYTDVNKKALKTHSTSRLVMP